MPDSFKITTIGTQHVEPKPLAYYKVDGTQNFDVVGDLPTGANSVTCTLTHLYHKGTGAGNSEGFAEMWTRQLHGRVTAGKWTVTMLAPLRKGKYVLTVGDKDKYKNDSDQGIQCILLDVSGPDIHEVTITGVVATADLIKVSGTALYGGESVQCSVTAVDNTGQRRPGTYTCAKLVYASQTMPYKWEASFQPYEIGGGPFKGMYSISALAYEGQAFTSVNVP